MDPTRRETARSRVRFASRLLDDAVRVPGTRFRFGLDPVLGLVPGAGDLASTLLSLYVVVEAVRLGLPAPTIAKMLAIVALDALLGSIPAIGVVFDAVFKANRRNLAILEAHLDRPTP